MLIHFTSFYKQLLLYALFSAVFLAFIMWMFLSLVPEQQPHIHEVVDIPAPSLTTDTWGLFDPETGTLIAGHNTDVVRPIASITKLFTAEAVIRSAKRDTPIMIMAVDVAEEGRAGKLTYGEKTTPYSLLYPLLLESSNDAAHAITRTLGSEYETTVSTLVSSLALPHTTIRDGSGLNPGNVSTVSELAIYYAHLRHDEPHILDITHLPLFIGESDGYINNNPARHFDTFMGGKHGLTDEAGRTFLGSFTSRDGETEIGVVLLGSDNLEADIEALITYGTHKTKDSAIIPAHI